MLCEPQVDSDRFATLVHVLGLIWGMKNVILTMLAMPSLLWAQGGPRPTDLGASPQAVGEAGVMWYTTWESALEEAKRSNRPIFFMSAAATCNGIPGVF